MNRTNRRIEGMMGNHTGGGSVTVRWRRGRGADPWNCFLGLSIDVGVFTLENSFALKLKPADSSETFIGINTASHHSRLKKV
jgi:hypothetical protein